MKKIIISLSVLGIFLVSCTNSAELDNLKKENAELTAQVNALKTGSATKGPKYILRLHLHQSHISLSIKKHLKDAANSMDFEIPVDKDFFDAVSEGTNIVDKFRFGSMILEGSYGDWELTVKEKIIK